MAHGLGTGRIGLLPECNYLALASPQHHIIFWLLSSSLDYNLLCTSINNVSYIIIPSNLIFHSDPFGECQDSYFVAFFKNANASQNRHIFLLSGQKEASMDIFTHSVAVSSSIDLDTFNIADMPVPPQAAVVTQFGAYSSDGCFIVGSNAEAASADAFASFPVQVNHREIEEYRAVSFRSSHRRDILYNSTVMVITSEDDTKIDMIATQDAVGHINSEQELTYYFNKGSLLPITLDKYQSLTISSVLDLTGTAIKAHHPVVVYSGHECANVPSYSSSCGHLVEQIPPVNVWGTCYVAAAFAGRVSGDYVRAIAANPGTYVCEVHSAWPRELQWTVWPIYRWGILGVLRWHRTALHI